MTKAECAAARERALDGGHGECLNDVVRLTETLEQAMGKLTRLAALGYLRYTGALLREDVWDLIREWAAAEAPDA